MLVSFSSRLETLANIEGDPQIKVLPGSTSDSDIQAICLSDLAFANNSGAALVAIPPSYAAENTAALKKQIKFNTDQEHEVYQSYLVYQRQLHHIAAINSSETESVVVEKKKIHAELCKRLKDILTVEQYDLFMAYEEQ